VTVPNPLLQIALVTWTNLRTLPQRLGASVASMVGVAGVVAVMVAVLSIAEGFQKTLASTGDDATVMVMRGGTDTEMNSVLPIDSTKIIADAPGIQRVDGRPLASAELFVIIDRPKKGTGGDANVPLRGVEETAFDVRPKVRIVEGRRFEPGRNEIIAGVGAVEAFEGLEVGNELRLGNETWTVVGTFEAGGTLPESELWADVKILGPAYMRFITVQSVYARLESPQAFTSFKDALTADPRLDVQVERESDYYAGQSEMLTTLIRVLGVFVAVLMGVGALFGAINTMYSAVSARAREIATLRALGFSGIPVVLSVLVESLVLSAAGGAVGAICAYIAFNGFRTATLNWDTFSQVTFAFAVTPVLMAQGLAYSLILGIIGGVFPAVRAARQPVASALRQL
jgi:putative ABC transport system permease protein